MSDTNGAKTVSTNLLIYLERCAVEGKGRIDIRQVPDNINLVDLVASGDFKIFPIEGEKNPHLHLLELSDDAWKRAHTERRARADRALKDMRGE